MKIDKQHLIITLVRNRPAVLAENLAKVLRRDEHELTDNLRQYKDTLVVMEPHFQVYFPTNV